MRDDFSAEVKRTIAARVGNHCSNPGCDKQTSGPQIDPTKALNVGVAAHITAASAGGPRYDPLLTSEERRDAKNAIWLCQNCAKLVDNDPIRFSVGELRGWKEQAEATALLRVTRSKEPAAPSPKDLPAADPDLKRFLEYLRGRPKAQRQEEKEGRFQKRYDQKLDGRLEISLRVKNNWDSEESTILKETFTEKATGGEAVEVITRIFNERGRLLIVGNPGSGKTVLLLKLAINLLHRIQTSDLESESIPVIFNLASWSEYYDEFDDWLNSVLVSGYGLSKTFASELLEKQKIILLLDGLDELARNEPEDHAAKKRSKCLSSLNKYIREKRKVIICCRTEQFLNLKTLTGKDAPVSAKVEVMDLTDKQVEAELNDAKRRELLHRIAAKNIFERKTKNEAFAEVLRIPFFFNIAQTVFDQQQFDKEVPEEAERLRKWLLDEFVEVKLSSSNIRKHYKSEKTKSWLKWLARFIEKKNLISFELSYLQSRDLKNVWLYVLMSCAIFSLYFLANGSIGILYLGFGLILLIRKLDPSRHGLSRSFLRPKKFFLRMFGYGLIGVVSYSIFICVFSIILQLLFSALNLYDFAVMLFTMYSISMPSILANCFCLGLWGALIEGSDFKTEDIIKPDWSTLFYWLTWRKILLSALKYGSICLVMGLALSFMVNEIREFLLLILDSDRTHLREAIVREIKDSYDMEYVFFYILIGLMLGFIFSARKSIQKTLRFAYLKTPYQRLKSGIFYNMFEWVTLFMLLLIPYMSRVFYYDQSYKEVGDDAIGLIIFVILDLLLAVLTLGFGLIYGLIGGFLSTPFFNHLILRLCLYLEGAMPLKYVTFLNHATEARILEKDGGQWRFRHQYLQDYFANRIT